MRALDEPHMAARQWPAVLLAVGCAVVVLLTVSTLAMMSIAEEAGGWPGWVVLCAAAPVALVAGIAGLVGARRPRGTARPPDDALAVPALLVAAAVGMAVGAWALLGEVRAGREPAGMAATGTCGSLYDGLTGEMYGAATDVGCNEAFRRRLAIAVPGLLLVAVALPSARSLAGRGRRPPGVVAAAGLSVAGAPVLLFLAWAVEGLWRQSGAG